MQISWQTLVCILIMNEEEKVLLHVYKNNLILSLKDVWIPIDRYFMRLLKITSRYEYRSTFRTMDSNFNTEHESRLLYPYKSQSWFWQRGKSCVYG